MLDSQRSQHSIRIVCCVLNLERVTITSKPSRDDLIGACQIAGRACMDNIAAEVNLRLSMFIYGRLRGTLTFDFQLQSQHAGQMLRTL